MLFEGNTSFLESNDGCCIETLIVIQLLLKHARKNLHKVTYGMQPFSTRHTRTFILNLQWQPFLGWIQYLCNFPLTAIKQACLLPVGMPVCKVVIWNSFLFFTQPFYRFPQEQTIATRLSGKIAPNCAIRCV